MHLAESDQLTQSVVPYMYMYVCPKLAVYFRQGYLIYIRQLIINIR